MDQRPVQPPEGRLIADAANRLDLSIREAARRAGISYGRWRQIVTGYQNVSPGSVAPVHAPAGTLAKMAAAVGVTPEQMDTEGLRPDAAEAMRHLAVTPSAAPERPVVRDFARVDDEEALKPYVEQVLRELYAAVGLTFGPGQRVPELSELPAMEKVLTAIPGKDIFPAEWEAHLWNSADVTPEERYRTVAILRQMTEGALKPDPRVRRIG